MSRPSCVLSGWLSHKAAAHSPSGSLDRLRDKSPSPALSVQEASHWAGLDGGLQAHPAGARGSLHMGRLDPRHPDAGPVLASTRQMCRNVCIRILLPSSRRPRGVCMAFIDAGYSRNGTLASVASCLKVMGLFGHQDKVWLEFPVLKIQYSFRSDAYKESIMCKEISIASCCSFLYHSISRR